MFLHLTSQILMIFGPLVPLGHMFSGIPLLTSWVLEMNLASEFLAFGLVMKQLTWAVTHLTLLTALRQNKTQNLTWVTLVILTEVIHMLIFSSLSLLVFFIFYEAVLMPLTLLISRNGSGNNRFRAAHLFFMFTLGGSAPMMLATLYLLHISGDGMGLEGNWGSALVLSMNSPEILTLWIAYAISFAIKTPLYPFILWLTSAHTEAPLEGSILLAGVVLKLAIFGVTSILMALFWEGGLVMMPFNLALSLTTLILSSLAMLQQVDLKSFVALSSVAHMALGTMGLLVLSEEGLGGAWVLSLAHGLVSPCLFLIIGGVLYQTLSTRLLYPLRGLSSALPLISGLLLLTLLINMGLPPFANWVSEVLILTGIAQNFKLLASGAATSIVFGTLYTFWYFNHISQGTWSPVLRTMRDISNTEITCVVYLVTVPLLLGIKGEGITETLDLGSWTVLSSE